MNRLITIAFAAVLALTACGDDDADTTTTTTLPSGSVIAEFRTPDGATYRALLTGDAAEHARSAFASGEPAGIPNGLILPGDGGVNLGHEWHIEDIEFADFTIEVCDGTVSYLDEVGYDAWVASQGDRYCPWGAELIDLIEA